MESTKPKFTIGRPKILDRRFATPRADRGEFLRQVQVQAFLPKNPTLAELAEASRAMEESFFVAAMARLRIPCALRLKMSKAKWASTAN